MFNVHVNNFLNSFNNTSNLCHPYLYYNLQNISYFLLNKLNCIILYSIIKLKVNPGAKERLVQITGPTEEKIMYVFKRLV